MPLPMRDMSQTETIRRLQREIELLNKYGEAKFGDEWWPAMAGHWMKLSQEDHEILGCDVDQPYEPAEPDGCECDNTHQAMNSVCRWCFNRGRRHWDDPEIQV